MPAQGALPPVHRAQETQLAARGGERLAPLPVSPWTSVPATTHRSWFLAGAILRRRPGDQDLQWLLRAVPRLRQNDLRHLKGDGRALERGPPLASLRSDANPGCPPPNANPPRHRSFNGLTIPLPYVYPLPVKRKTVRFPEPNAAGFPPAFSSAQTIGLPIVEALL